MLILSKLLCKIGLHSWRDGPGEPCTECGKEDDLCKDIFNPPPLPTLPEWARDGIINSIELNFNFIDRIKILIHGTIKIKSHLAIQNLPGIVEPLGVEVYVKHKQIKTKPHVD